MKNIEENNRLIAEFIGMQETDIGWYDFEEVLNNEYSNTFDGLYFHNDWNWLMEVLKEIDNLEIEIPEDSNLYGDITHGLLSFDIEMTYEAVVEFIKWYKS